MTHDELMTQLIAQLRRRLRITGYLCVVLAVAAIVNIACAAWMIAQLSK